MGIISSSPVNPYEKIREQLDTLGNRHPFGNEDLLRLSRCLAYLNNSSSNQIKRVSFLSDWAVLCSTLPKAKFVSQKDLTSLSLKEQEELFVNILHVDPSLLDIEARRSKLEIDEEIIYGKIRRYNAEDLYVQRQRQRILYILGILEEFVLPTNFSEIFHQRLFALLKPSGGMDRNRKEGSISSDTIAWDKLQQFLNGVSDASMRGSRKALTCIFQCCCADADNTRTKKAKAQDLLDLCYRLSLAVAMYDEYMKNQRLLDIKKESDKLREERMRMKAEKKLENENNAKDGSEENDEKKEDEEEEEEEEEMIVPMFDPSSFYPMDTGGALAQSLADYATKSSQQGPNASYFEYTTTPSSTTENNSNSGNDDPTMVTLDTFLTWAETTLPCLSSTMETFLHRIFFPDKPYPPSRTQFLYPNLRRKHSAFFPSPNDIKLFTLASMSSSLGGAWHRLYTSDEDGLSFNRLQNALLGYSGPTILIIKEADNGGVFGACTSTAWKESKDFYGNSDCFLFTVTPNVSVLRPRGAGTNYMYCNSESRSRGYDGQAHGIGFGGTTLKPRLFISESFDGCMAATGDLTFEAGPLLPSQLRKNKDIGIDTPPPTKYFDLESLEVWGVGGDAVVAEALGDRSKQREIVAANIRKARKVDKAQFLDDFKSGLIESKAFNHRAQIQGREECHIDDDDGNKYVYEK